MACGPLGGATTKQLGRQCRADPAGREHLGIVRRRQDATAFLALLVRDLPGDAELGAGQGDAVLLVAHPVAGVGAHLRRERRPQRRLLAIRRDLREAELADRLALLDPWLGQPRGRRLLLADERQPMKPKGDIARRLPRAPLVGQVALARSQVAQRVLVHGRHEHELARGPADLDDAGPIGLPGGARARGGQRLVENVAQGLQPLGRSPSCVPWRG